MDFNALIAELRASSENLPKESADRSHLSSIYCEKACKALDRIADGTIDYDNVITGLWLIAAHFAEQLAYLKPVPALSELCYKLFRQCARAVLNIQWQNLEDDSSLKQNFLVSLANLHAKLVPFDFPRFRLLEALTENPWTNPTLAKVMGGEVEDSDREEVRCYIEQEDPIILQLRVDMMLKENCEEYALNLCNSCLSHPELQSDLSVRKTQLSLLYKLGQEDKLQEECQKLSIQDAVRIIKQLQQSKTHRQICTVLAQTFMVQNWIRPSDLEANKELLRLWIRHQVLVDREQDQFKESVWAMAKLSQSTEQIIIFIDVLREECGEAFLQLYVDMCIFAINVDKGQMETSLKEGNMEAAAARRSDMASICAKLSCLCHHTSIKVARICALTYFALQPSEQSFAKIGTFYGQGSNCCNKCGSNRNQDHGVVNPATLYEVERLLNMLRPEYLNPDNSYAKVQIMCRRFLQESLQTAQQMRGKQQFAQGSTGPLVIATTQVEGPGKKKSPVPPNNRPTNVFEAFSQQDVHNTQVLLNKMRLQNAPAPRVTPVSQKISPHIFPSGSIRPTILHHGQQPHVASADEVNKAQFVFDTENAKNKQPYGVPLDQQHQYYLLKHERELEQRRKNAQKKREGKTYQDMPANLPVQQQQQQQPQYKQQSQQQPQRQYQRQPPMPSQQNQDLHNKQVTQIIQTALRQDSDALHKLTQSASPQVVQAVLNIMKGTVLKTTNQHQQQLKSGASQGSQPLPTVSTLLKPSQPLQQQQQAQPCREQPPSRRHPRPQLYAQPIIVSTSNNLTPQAVRVQQSNESSLQSRSISNVSSSAIVSTTAAQKQKAESFLQAKSHVEDIRKFMQMQMSNLPQKQISEPRQMSGSTVTLNTSGAKLPLSTSTNASASRPKTTVELAQQAALINLQKHQQGKQNAGQQLQPTQVHVYTCHSTQSLQKPKQLAFSKTPGVQQQQPQQQRLLQLHPQQQSSSVSFQSSTVTQNPVLPSSDELSGSIMSVDDTIIKELLQDSGILANTFPDIEVDSIGEDKSKKVPDFPTSSQFGILSTHHATSSQKQDHSFSSNPASLSQTYIKPGPSSSLPVSGSSSSRLNQQHNISASDLPGSVVQPSGTRLNQYLVTSASTRVYNPAHYRSVTASGSVQSSFAKPDSPRATPLPNTSVKQNISVLSRDNSSMLTQSEVKQEAKPTMDQLKELMKREDIQGEVCMDASNNATYRCIICSLAFETLDYLREHVRTVCKPGLQSSSVYNSKIKQDRANSAKAGLETTTVFQCLRCFELCVSDAGIKQHRLTCKRVPTVPSDLKKDTPSPKTKSAPKNVNSGKQHTKKEHKDNSHNVPEIPLPFPYPSLNAGAVLKSLSEAGSSIPKSSVSNLGVKSQPVVTSSVANLMSLDLPTTSLTNTRPYPSTAFSSSQPPNVTNSTDVSSVLGNGHGNPPSIPKDNQNSNSFSEPKNLVTTGPEREVSEEKSNSELKPDQKENVELMQAKDKEQRLPPPSFTEILGSGGSKFYKCKNCSQTLCSLESFYYHWRECAVKHESVLIKRSSRDKIFQAPPLAGVTLENVKNVIEAVAAGDGAIGDITRNEELSDEDFRLWTLKDPCRMLSDKRSPESDTYSENENTTDSSDRGTREEDTYSTSTNEKDSIDDTRKSKTSERRFKEDTEEEEEEGEEETDNSTSESERNSLLLSTREAPPRLRDRKTLKPIQSFINETFMSPYSKVIRHGQMKEDDLEAELPEDKGSKVSSGSEVDSDGDSLFCRICKSTFQNKRILLQHFAAKHLKPYTVKTVADSSSYFCHLCQKSFSTFMHYMQHVPNHSVTIYEKMRVFTASKKSSQRSERIATQRGFTKKSNISPKMAKALKSKKVAVDRLKLLAGKTQSVRERLRMSKRKRSLHGRFTSSEDDYSSDASNNVVFKSNKLAESGNKSDSQRYMTRRGRNANRKQENQSQSPGDESSVLSSGEEGELVPRSRLSRVKDEDYVASEDLDSDSTSRRPPPATRSRKRSGQMSDSIAASKRRRTSSPFGTTNESDANSEGEYKREHHSRVITTDSDADSNSTVLLLSENNDGNFLPIEDKAEAGGSTDDPVEKHETNDEASHCSQFSSRRVILRSLSKKQKEQLRSCDLHPSVVLETLQAGDVQASGQDSCGRKTQSVVDSPSFTTAENQQTGSVNISDEARDKTFGTSDTSSFLDSYLSYLNQYKNFSNREKQSVDGLNKSETAGQGRHRSRRNSMDDKNLRSHHNRSPSGLTRCSSTDRESSTLSSDSSYGEIEGSGKHSEGHQENFQNILSKFRTRSCSVNLGHKINPATLGFNKELSVEIGESSNASIENGERKLISPKYLDKLSTECRQSPVVCLERSHLADLYAVKTATISIETKAEEDVKSEDESNKEDCENKITIAPENSPFVGQNQLGGSEAKDITAREEESCKIEIHRDGEGLSCIDSSLKGQVKTQQSDILESNTGSNFETTQQLSVSNEELPIDDGSARFLLSSVSSKSEQGLEAKLLCCDKHLEENKAESPVVVEPTLNKVHPCSDPRALVNRTSMEKLDGDDTYNSGIHVKSEDGLTCVDKSGESQTGQRSVDNDVVLPDSGATPSSTKGIASLQPLSENLYHQDIVSVTSDSVASLRQNKSMEPATSVVPSVTEVLLELDNTQLPSQFKMDQPEQSVTTVKQEVSVTSERDAVSSEQGEAVKGAVQMLPTGYENVKTAAVFEDNVETLICKAETDERLSPDSAGTVNMSNIDGSFVEVADDHRTEHSVQDIESRRSVAYIPVTKASDNTSLGMAFISDICQTKTEQIVEVSEQEGEKTQLCATEEESLKSMGEADLPMNSFISQNVETSAEITDSSVLEKEDSPVIVKKDSLFTEQSILAETKDIPVSRKEDSPVLDIKERVLTEQRDTGLPEKKDGGALEKMGSVMTKNGDRLLQKKDGALLECRPSSFTDQKDSSFDESHANGHLPEKLDSLPQVKDNSKTNPDSTDRNRKTTKKGKSPSKPFQNPNISLAAFIAERLIKEDKKSSNTNYKINISNKASAVLPAKPKSNYDRSILKSDNLRPHGEPLHQSLRSAQIPQPHQTRTTNPDQPKAKSEKPQDEKQIGGKSPVGKNSKSAEGTLGLVDYSSSDDENDATESDKLESSSSGKNPAKSVKSAEPSTNHSLQQVILLRGAHYSHSVFIPAEAKGVCEEQRHVGESGPWEISEPHSKNKEELHADTVAGPSDTELHHLQISSHQGEGCDPSELESQTKGAHQNIDHHMEEAVGSDNVAVHSTELENMDGSQKLSEIQADQHLETEKPGRSESHLVVQINIDVGNNQNGNDKAEKSGQACAEDSLGDFDGKPVNSKVENVLTELEQKSSILNTTPSENVRTESQCESLGSEQRQLEDDDTQLSAKRDTEDSTGELNTSDYTYEDEVNLLSPVSHHANTEEESTQDVIEETTKILPIEIEERNNGNGEYWQLDNTQEHKVESFHEHLISEECTEIRDSSQQSVSKKCLPISEHDTGAVLASSTSVGESAQDVSADEQKPLLISSPLSDPLDICSGAEQSSGAEGVSAVLSQLEVITTTVGSSVHEETSSHLRDCSDQEPDKESVAQNEVISQDNTTSLEKSKESDQVFDRDLAIPQCQEEKEVCQHQDSSPSTATKSPREEFLQVTESQKKPVTEIVQMDSSCIFSTEGKDLENLAAISAADLNNERETQQEKPGTNDAVKFSEIVSGNDNKGIEEMRQSNSALDQTENDVCQCENGSASIGEVMNADSLTDQQKVEDKTELTIQSVSKVYSVAYSAVTRAETAAHEPKESSRNEKKEDDNEGEEGDDLSDFDLVIEKDTSPRSILSFPSSTMMKRSGTKLPFTDKRRSSPVPSKMEQMGNSSGNKPMKMNTKQGKHSHAVKKSEGTVDGPVPRKPLGGAKALRKSSQEQFVWDVDEDSDLDRVTAITAPVPISSAVIAAAANEKQTSPALEILRRKQKALREKMDTSPFTWDLEEVPDKDHSAQHNEDFLSVVGPTAECSKSHNNSTQKSSVDNPARKDIKRISRAKRPLTPDVVQRKKPSKVRRTSSLDKQSKIPNSANDKELEEQDKKQLNIEKEGVDGSSFQGSVEITVSSNSILIDDEISFKKDSFSPSIEFISVSGQNSPADSTASEDVKRKKGRPRKQHLQTKSNLNQDEKLSDSPHSLEVSSPRNQLGLRSRHSSVDSNKSDQSVSSKRQSEGSPLLSTKRPRKSEDPLTPKLRKAGLIKITKDSSSSPTSGGLDATAPMTRSSEAAIKAFNQKSLRNRGVNPVSPANSPVLSASRSSPVISLSKTTTDSNSKLKSASPSQKSSPSLTSRHVVGLDIASDDTIKGPSRKSIDSNTTTAVVRRRGPSASLPPSTANRNRTALTPRSGKSIGRSKVNHPLAASTTVFRVDPVPNMIVSRGTSKSATVTPTKETKTVHTRLPPGTTLKPKKETKRQPNWKISKVTKQVRGRKSHKSAVPIK